MRSKDRPTKWTLTLPALAALLFAVSMGRTLANQAEGRPSPETAWEKKRGLCKVEKRYVPCPDDPAPWKTTKALRISDGKELPGVLIITPEAVYFFGENKVGFRPTDEVTIEADKISRIQSSAFTKGPSAGEVFAIGLWAMGSRRNFTTLGIETTDGGVFVFSIKGQDALEYVWAVERLAEKAPSTSVAKVGEESASSADAASRDCTIEQIAAMARAGMTDEQIKAACADGGSPK